MPLLWTFHLLLTSSALLASISLFYFMFPLGPVPGSHINLKIESPNPWNWKW